MNEFNTLEDVAAKIKSDLDDAVGKKISLLYAFNGTGKTRLTSIIKIDFALSYDAFFEDMFTWDNERFILKFDIYSKIIKFIKDQGLENQITDKFQQLTGSKIHPNYNLDNGEITFNFAAGDERSENNIKISKGEESVFVWSIFYVVLEFAIYDLNDAVENRESNEFNDLNYIVIDDPISSIDDTMIIAMALDLIKVIKLSKNNKLKFLITTHHALFYNIVFNEFRKKKEQKSFWLLSKSGANFTLVKSNSDSPFGYHLVIRNKIQEAIDTDNLEKYHFNLFRSLLEKSANFLGYDNWSDCLENNNRNEIIKLVNLYSHGKLSELESKHFSNEHKDIFKDAFNAFIHVYKWKL